MHESNTNASGVTSNGFIDLGDLQPARVKYRIGGKPYILCEATADAAIKYRNRCIAATKYDSKTGARVGVEGLADAEPFLLSMCLFHAGDDGELRLNTDGEPDVRYAVPVQAIRKFPNHVQRTLFDKCHEISGLEGRWTIPTLKKEIERLQDILKDMEGEQGEGGPANPTSAATETASS